MGYWFSMVHQKIKKMALKLSRAVEVVASFAQKVVKAAISIVDRVVDLLGNWFSWAYQEIPEIPGKVSRALDTALEEVASFAKNVFKAVRVVV
ncbi:hypothetical protein L1987_54403 [Smallanthus sonchifolius]|uniref:Uncharacterized protein n=1 Tax=Smallanthus sonchifolius TaxID=185202 RepID=A0ACB9E837_9ASTR|nr:hypothetical protein L1987_54403 [Smallanthus sonchifolius]